MSDFPGPYEAFEVTYAPPPIGIVAKVLRVENGVMGTLVETGDEKYALQDAHRADGAIGTDVLPNVVFSPELGRVFESGGSGTYELGQVADGPR